MEDLPQAEGAEREQGRQDSRWLSSSISSYWKEKKRPGTWEEALECSQWQGSEVECGPLINGPAAKARRNPEILFLIFLSPPVLQVSYSSDTEQSKWQRGQCRWQRNRTGKHGVPFTWFPKSLPKNTTYLSFKQPPVSPGVCSFLLELIPVNSGSSPT